MNALELFKTKNLRDNNNNNFDGKIDIIIMDCLMPIKNGYEASFEIK